MTKLLAILLFMEAALVHVAVVCFATFCICLFGYGTYEQAVAWYDAYRDGKLQRGARRAHVASA
jgi:hypothetical protein